MLQLFYGGTFDPIHNGHLAIARAARDELRVPVRLMPAADPPHRAPPGASAQQRAHLLDLAVEDEAGLCVDRRELLRAERMPEARSYTVDTLHELRAEQGDAVPLALLIGADSLLGLPTWREWHSLFGLAHFVVADRPGSPLDDGLPAELADALLSRWTSSPEALGSAPSGLLYRLSHPLQPESATEIRRRIATGDAWRHLVPGRVAVAIADERLYLERAATPGPL
ncbi:MULTISPECIES: nicotinate-nucleotide adenylyltransferase [unclassified Pseudoxanthomonas]|uniref:nicotinate-nucleotide adenylyltransferase n=1 Tax=unclassified Pseudoxanthomonas TaxID=2645906 RepID=UPI0008EEE8CB|nr:MULTISPECIES: nicotinate-nucleotide adenylyltransferase [unclassified Pseudoxanthomonas]PPJ43590.1 nicotinate-nucleotide adenylyltransferase [Pseudoxanthomonas sp. KAs_5_3]SFV35782.1 nicotinate-nucleotide adenylyltransferase [Pseudoxanthomonas sp. YR558]